MGIMHLQFHTRHYQNVFLFYVIWRYLVMCTDNLECYSEGRDFQLEANRGMQMKKKWLFITE